MKRPLIKIYNMFRTDVQSRMSQWLLFTVLFGTLPILIRLLAAVTATESGVAYVSIQEFVFLGLIFNVASLANITIEKDKPTVYPVVVGWTVCLSFFLIIMYTVTLIEPNTSWLAWPITIVLLLLTVPLSWLTADVEAMQEWQYMHNAEDILRCTPENLKSRVRKRIDQRKEGEELLPMVVIEEFLRDWKETHTEKKD